MIIKQWNNELYYTYGCFSWQTFKVKKRLPQPEVGIVIPAIIFVQYFLNWNLFHDHLELILNLLT